MSAQAAERFLDDYEGRTLPWTRPAGAPHALETDRILFGNGDHPLEVAIASAAWPGQPRAEDLRGLFKKRQANRPAPVLLVVMYPGPDAQALAAVVGTIGDPAPATGLDVDRLAPGGPVVTVVGQDRVDPVAQHGAESDQLGAVP